MSRAVVRYWDGTRWRKRRAKDEAVWQKSKAISCGRCRKLGTCRSSEAFKQDCVEGNVVLECRLCEPNMA